MPFAQRHAPGNAGGRLKRSIYSEQLGLHHHTARRRHVRGTVLATSIGRKDVDVDIAIIGGGIIGLATTFSLLQKTQNKKFSIALIESNDSIPAPAIGSGAATGAGQGYIWLAHRKPDSPAWAMAVHSKHLWGEWLDPAACNQVGTHSSVEWQPAGSLLLAASDAEASQLADRQRLLEDAGVQAELWDADRLHAKEPAVGPGISAGLLVQSDAQLNGRMAAAALLAACQSSPGFLLLLGQAVEGWELHQNSSRVTAVLTPNHRILVRENVVVAAGAWSGDLIAAALATHGAQQGSQAWLSGLQPRKGHLLELPGSCLPRITHGLMEIGYAKHYAAGHADPRQLDIAFTATTSVSGTLLLGSSREFCGFDGEPSEAVLHAILQRAQTFLPGVCDVSRADISVRVGLRPYADRGLPYIGPVPGVPGLFVAAGHEGSGLSLAPATGELLSSLILGYGADAPYAEHFLVRQ